MLGVQEWKYLKKLEEYAEDYLDTVFSASPDGVISCLRFGGRNLTLKARMGRSIPYPRDMRDILGS